MNAPLPPATALPTAGPIPLGETDVTCSRGFAHWLAMRNLSFAFTSYQSGQLYLVGTDPEGRLALHQTGVGRTMGVWSDRQRLVLATDMMVWRFENILAHGETMAGGVDRHFIPRSAHVTGDLDLHDVAVLGDGRIVVVNTSYSCLATLSLTHSFRPLWTPPFISRLAPEDRCHLNGLAVVDGAAAYVTATSRSDVVGGWRQRRAEGGLLMDVRSNTIITEKLSMPHSPRWHNGRVWLLNSGTGHLGTVDPVSGAFEAVAFCPGFLRGLAFVDTFAFVGLSRPRNGGAFSGLALDAELGRRDADPVCGVHIVDTSSGNVVHWLHLGGQIAELFDVIVLPGMRRPVARSPIPTEVNEYITMETA